MYGLYTKSKEDFLKALERHYFLDFILSPFVCCLYTGMLLISTVEVPWWCFLGRFMYKIISSGRKDTFTFSSSTCLPLTSFDYLACMERASSVLFLILVEMLGLPIHLDDVGYGLVLKYLNCVEISV